jgi:branched-chain amino acid transport system permease protein
METLLLQLFNGLATGSLYALIAAGLALIFGVVEIVNFAHGEFYMVGGYILYVFLIGLNLPYWLCAIFVIGAMTLFGVVFEYLVIRPIIHRPWWVWLVATLGTQVILTNLAIIIFGLFPKNTPTPYAVAILEIGFFRISQQRLFVLVVGVLVFVLLHLFVQRTKIGKAMRAVSQNREMCPVVGIDVQKVALVAFAIGSALCGVASVLSAPLLNVVPTMGVFYTTKAFAAVIMGGFGRVNGAIAAAFLLGIAEALVSQYISSLYVNVLSFVLMLLVLVFRPSGLFSRGGVGI